jgi:hypothetical protein
MNATVLEYYIYVSGPTEHIIIFNASTIPDHRSYILLIGWSDLSSRNRPIFLERYHILRV